MSSNTVFQHHLLILDDSPVIMQELQNDFASDALRIVFADTLDALRRQLKTLADSKATPDLFILGADVSPKTANSALQTLQQLYPEVKWLNIVDQKLLNDSSSEALEKRLQMRPLTTLLATDKQGLLLNVADYLQHQNLRNDLHNARSRLDDIENRFERLLHTSKEAIAYISSGLHEYANPAFLEMVDCQTLEELSEHSILEILAPQSDEASLKDMLKQIEKGKTNMLEIQAKLHSPSDPQKRTPVLAALQPAIYDQENCIQLTIRPDTTPIVQPATDLEISNGVLMPRAAFLSQAEHKLAQIDDSDTVAIGVLCVSLDSFSEIKENIGLLASDALIEERAELLKSCLDDSTDLITQYTEHAYAILVERAQRPAIEQLAKHISETVGSQIAEIEEHHLSVTCSIGYTFAGMQSRDTEKLISQAVRTAREAIQAGPGEIKRYRPELATVDAGDDHGHWQERLRHALDNKEFCLRSNVISDIVNDQQHIYDFELCLQQNKEPELISCHDFIDKIEGSPLHYKLERLALRYFIKHLTDHQDDIAMLNITPHVHDPKSFAELIFASLKYLENDGEQIIISVDSQLLEHNMQPMSVLAKTLKPTKIQWAIDNVGATDNAAQLIHHLRPQYARLTDTMVPKTMDMIANEAFSKILNTCRATNTQLIARNVDSAACVPVLWQAGITLIQGGFVKHEQRLIG